MKFTTFIITVIIASLFVTGFGLLMADLNTHYDLSSSNYDDSKVQLFNKLDETHNLSVQIQERVSNYETDRSIYDIIGGFLADGRDTILIGIQSMDFLTDMANSGFELLGIDPIFRTAFVIILIIIVFVGITLSIVIGRDL